MRTLKIDCIFNVIHLKSFQVLKTVSHHEKSKKKNEKKKTCILTDNVLP